MLENGRVLGHDPFGVPESPSGQPQQWVNIHWGFQLIVASVHAIGGFSGLVGLKMAMLVAAMAIVMVPLRRKISPAWMMLVALGMILCMAPRARARPEVLTFVLLAATLMLIESVRGGASVRRLWWLVPKD